MSSDHAFRNEHRRVKPNQTTSLLQPNHVKNARNRDTIMSRIQFGDCKINSFVVEYKDLTLCTLRDMLLEQPEPEAKQIALSLELHTTGSLDIFGKQSNVDLDKCVVVFDIHGLGSQLKPTGLLVITDTMLNRVTLNWKKGKRTHVFIDEFHVVFENEFSAQFFNSAWRQFRKRNAYLLQLDFRLRRESKNQRS